MDKILNNFLIFSVNSATFLYSFSLNGAVLFSSVFLQFGQFCTNVLSMDARALFFGMITSNATSGKNYVKIQTLCMHLYIYKATYYNLLL